MATSGIGVLLLAMLWSASSSGYRTIVNDLSKCNYHNVLHLPVDKDEVVVLRYSGKSVKKPCLLIVDAKESGFFVEVVSMSLRRNKKTNQCIDFVQWSDGPQYCGDCDDDDDNDDDDDDDDDDDHYHHNHHKKMLKNAIIANSSFQVNFFQAPSYYAGLLELVIYPIRDCHKSYSACMAGRDAICEMSAEEVFSGEHFFCGTYCKHGPNSLDADFNGHNFYDHYEANNGTAITIAALSSLLITFSGFIICIWTCRKFRILCWSPPSASNSNSVAYAGNTSTGPQDVEMGPQREATPDAPSAPSVDLDKDLPPSYESLFPSNTANNSDNTITN